MARDWYYTEAPVTTVAGTAIATPLTTAVTLQDSFVNRIKIRWPEGHNGRTGIYLAQQGSAIVPYGTSPTFIVANDDEEWFAVGEEVQGGLQAVTYNTGVYPHTHYLRIEYMPISQWQGEEAIVPNIQAIPSPAEVSS
jgi:hypothetical protein